MDTSDLTHVIVTRFNVGIYGATCRSKSYMPPDDPDAWCKSRIHLLQKITAKAIRRQRIPVRWCILVDPRTPPDVLRDLACVDGAEIIATRSMRPLPGNGPTWWDRLADKLGCRTPWLATTRLDSDDALHADVAIHVARHPRRPCVVDFPVVCLWDRNQRQYRVQTSIHKHGGINPTVIEPWTDAPATCLATSHTKLGELAPIERIRTTEPMLLQTLHGANIGTQRNGKPYQNEPLPKCFRWARESSQLPTTP